MNKYIYFKYCNDEGVEDKNQSLSLLSIKCIEEVIDMKGDSFITHLSFYDEGKLFRTFYDRSKKQIKNMEELEDYLNE